MAPPATAIRAARMNLRQLSSLRGELLDLRLEALDLVVRIVLAHILVSHAPRCTTAYSVTTAFGAFERATQRVAEIVTGL